MELPVKTASDKRYDTQFDFDIASKWLLEIAQSGSKLDTTGGTGQRGFSLAFCCKRLIA